MPSPQCLNSPVPSSSECSSVVTSTKRARTRTPRKRPNQSYTEAALLLSKVYPSVFTTANTTFRRHRYSPMSFRSVSPPPFLAGYLIEDDPSRSPVSYSKPAPSPLLCGAGFDEQGSPDYDVESILDEEVGIDSIMGSLGPESNAVSSAFTPLFGGLMGFGTGGQNSITRQALRGAHGGEWWRSSTMVEVKDIVPELDVLPKKTASKKKKKNKKKKSNKKKKKKEVVKDDSSSSLSSEGKLKSGLGLKLNYKHVADAWSDRQFPFAKDAGVHGFSAEDLARLAEVDLTPDMGGAREGSVQRFREKRKTRLFSKKIRYQVRNVNADCRPRMKASDQFAKRSSPHQEAKEVS